MFDDVDADRDLEFTLSFADKAGDARSDDCDVIFNKFESCDKNEESSG